MVDSERYGSGKHKHFSEHAAATPNSLWVEDRTEGKALMDAQGWIPLTWPLSPKSEAVSPASWWGSSTGHGERGAASGVIILPNMNTSKGGTLACGYTYFRDKRGGQNYKCRPEA